MMMMMTMMMIMAGRPFITQLILSLSLFIEAPLSQEPGANFEHTPRSPPNISVNNEHLAM
jgi:hypothetical protein